MELVIKVDESKAKQFIGFLETLEYVEVAKPASKKKRKQPKFDYFGSCPDWQPDAKELRNLSNRKKAQW